MIRCPMLLTTEQANIIGCLDWHLLGTRSFSAIQQDNAHDTILNFTNGGGWDSDGLSYAIGIVPMIGILIVSTPDVYFAVESYDASQS